MAGADNTRTIRCVAPSGVGPFLVHRFSGTETLGRLFEYEVDLLSLDQAIAFDKIMGQPLTLIIEANRTDTERIVHGWVSRFTQRDKRDRYMQYRATLVPYLWFLNRVSDCRIMPPMMTVPDIVKRILAEDHFTDVDDRGLDSANYVPRPYCVQYRETDFNFISRLLEDEGIYYFFRHERQSAGADKFKHVMVLCDQAAHHDVGEGCETLHVPDNRGTVVTITEWRRAGQAHADEATLRDFSYELRQRLPKNARFNYTPPEVEFTKPTQALVTDHPAGFHSKHDDDDRYLRTVLRVEEQSARRTVRRGVTHVRGLFAGKKFKLDTSPAEEYLVISSQHSGWSDTGESDAGGATEERYVCSFEAIEGNRQFRPARITPKPTIVGPQTALVVGDANNHAFTDKYGNVRVKFHWDSSTEMGEKTSCLVRVAETWAGSNWGVMFHPRVGHEVVVEFLDGDPDRPLITGRVYNGRARPPYDPRQHASVSTIKSMSTENGPGFNELRFEDKKGSEQLFLHAQRQMDERVGADLRETVGGDRDEHIGKDGKGDRNRLVSADVNWHVKGTTVELIEAKLNRNVKQEVVQVFEDNHSIKVTDRQTLNAKEIAIEAKEAVSFKGPKVVFQGADGLSMKAGNVKIEGNQGISLKVGGTFLVIGPSGVSVSNAASVFLNSGGAPQPADPPLTIEDPTLETPIDAVDAASALPGQQVTGGAPAPRTRKSQKISLQRAPEPPPPPPTHPAKGGAADRQFIDIAWVERETTCGGPATLKGTTKGYDEGASEDAEIRNIIDGATVVAVPIGIHGNAFNQHVEVRDWMPRKSGDGFEEVRDEDAFAAGQKTPKPLTMRFFPTLTRAACALVSRTGVHAQFEMEVKDYACKVLENVTYVKGYMGQLIKLGANVPANTKGQVKHSEGPEDPNTLSGDDWRFAKEDPDHVGKLLFWDGAHWKDVPATWRDRPIGTKLFGIGIWRDGSANKTQFGFTWPDPIPDWAPNEKSQADSVITTWKSKTNEAWTNKFDLRRFGCSSGNTKCCRYSVQIIVDFKAVAAAKMDDHTIVIGINNARSNSFAWSIADTRPGLGPHEFGHHLGCPDEYPGAAIDTAVTTDIPDVTKPGIDETCLMGSVPNDSVPPIKARHLDIIKQQLAAMLKDQKGKTFTFTAVPHI